MLRMTTEEAAMPNTVSKTTAAQREHERQRKAAQRARQKGATPLTTNGPSLSSISGELNSNVTSLPPIMNGSGQSLRLMTILQKVSQEGPGSLTQDEIQL